MGGLRHLRNVVTLELDEARCNGCSMCIQVCPHGVFALERKRARITERDACMECGACSMNCPESAISVRAGVGCAAAVINQALGRTGDDCCSIDSSACCG